MNSPAFQIRLLPDAQLASVILEDTQSGIFACILPEHGALLNQFSFPARDGKSQVEVVAGYSSSADLAKNELLFYRSAKLSPFVCRIDSASYRIGEKVYTFPRKFTDGSAIHGILSDKKFEVVETEADGTAAMVLLKHDYRGDNPGYPFPFTLSVKYTLKDKGRLELSTTVENLSTETIPLADGWHPYFSLGGTANDWHLLLNCNEMLELNEKLVPSGIRTESDMFRTMQPIGSRALDNCFIADPVRGSAPAAILFNPENKLRLSFFPEISYPFLQIYTPDDRLSIAIENLSGAPDSFNNGIGLIRLAPGKKQSFTVTYQLDQPESSTLQP